MTRPRQTITHIRAELLTVHPDNIRDDLGDLTDMARSIREHGILQPITVTEHRLGGFLILAGHRRFAAGQLIALETYPAIIRHGLDDHAEQLVVMLVENTQRRDLDPIEKAQAYGALINSGLSQTEIARRVGCTPSTVNYYLAFLDLDADSVDNIRAGKITAGEARDAVVEVRQAQRVAVGRAPRGRRPHQAAYFGVTHRLANTVVGMCDHTERQIVGKSGCGECWEKAIIDEFVVVNTVVPDVLPAEDVAS